jgi:hypothetical protein
MRARTSLVPHRLQPSETARQQLPRAPHSLARSVPRLALLLLMIVVVLVLVPVAGAMGFFGPRTYLVVSQDPAELRPYGGYVGAYAAVVMLFGRVDHIDYGDTKDLDTPTTRPLFAASDSPDFRVAAAAMADVLGQATEQWPDAVIGLDPVVASGLLALVGPLSLPGEARPVTPDNLLGIVLEHTQDFDDPEADRKEVVYELGRTLAGHLRALPPTRWPEVLGALGRAADERHVQIYLRDPVLQRLVHAKGWDGSYPTATADDFLAVVDDNIGYNKANLVTEQMLDYQVSIGADGARAATLTIGYANRGTRQLNFSAEAMPYLNQATYVGSISIYVPIGARMLTTGQPAAQAADLGRGVFVQRVLVPPEGRASLVLTYQLPNQSVEPRRMSYGLMVRKQAGTQSTPIRVRVIGPEGWHVAGATGRDWTAEAALTTDQRFDVVFEPSQRD